MSYPIKPSPAEAFAYARHAFCVMDFPRRPGGVIERMPEAVREALQRLKPADCSCIDEGYFETMKEMKKRGVARF